MAPDTNLQRWLDAFFDSRASFRVSLLNHPGRLRMPAGWGVRLNPLPNHLLYFAAEGGFDADVNGETMRVEPGDLIWASIGSAIYFRLPPGETSLVAWRFRVEARGADGELLPPVRPYWHLTRARQHEALIAQIVDEAAYPGEHSPALLRALVICLCTETFRSETAHENQSGHLTRSQRAALQQYFVEHAKQWPTPADLAHEVELSPDYFTRCFRRTYGVPPRRWLLEERLRLAALRLLETPANISEISRDLGYEDVFLFSRQFKSVHGVSPTEYRQTHGGIGRLLRP